MKFTLILMTANIDINLFPPSAGQLSFKDFVREVDSREEEEEEDDLSSEDEENELYEEWQPLGKKAKPSPDDLDEEWRPPEKKSKSSLAKDWSSPRKKEKGARDNMWTPLGKKAKAGQPLRLVSSIVATGGILTDSSAMGVVSEPSWLAGILTRAYQYFLFC
jgi:hypothetical protein